MFIRMLLLMLACTQSLMAATWGPSELVGSHGDFDDDSFSMVINKNGDALVVFSNIEEPEEGTYITSIMYNIKKAEGTLLKPMLLAQKFTSNEPVYFNPKVAFTEQGIAHALWVKPEGDGYVVHGAMLLSLDSPWWIADALPNITYDAVYGLRLGFDDKGNGFAVWSAIKNGLYSIECMRYGVYDHEWKALPSLPLPYEWASKSVKIILVEMCVAFRVWDQCRCRQHFGRFN